MISESYINRYFDHIYVLNLRFEVANRLLISHHLTKHGVAFELFEATNGYQGEPLHRYKEYQARELGDFKRYLEYSEIEKTRKKPYIESAGAIGIIYSLLRILKDSKKKGYKRFLIFEDDVLLSKDFESRFKSCIQSIDEDWKILQLGASQFHWSDIDLSTATRNGFYFPRSLFTYGSFAVAFDSSVVDELIEAVSAFDAPFDHLPMGELYERYLGKCFVAYPNIVIADVTTSSVRELQDQHTEASRRKWTLSDFEFPLKKPSITVLITSKMNLLYHSSLFNTDELPFSLKLVFRASNVLRPFQSADLINSLENRMQSINQDVDVSASDYLVTMDQGAILTKRDIVKYLEYKTGLLEENVTPLKEVKNNPQDLAKSMQMVFEKNAATTLAQIPEIEIATNKAIAIFALIDLMKMYESYKELVKKIVHDT